MFSLSVCGQFDVLGAEEVVDGFDGVEGGEGDFDEVRVPFGHGSVPESRQFERFEGLPGFEFFGDEAGLGIDELVEVEGGDRGDRVWRRRGRRD